MGMTRKLGFGAALAAALAFGGTARAQAGASGQGATGSEQGATGSGQGATGSEQGATGSEQGTGAMQGSGQSGAMGGASGAQTGATGGASAGTYGGGQQSATAQGAAKPLPKKLQGAAEKLHADNQAEVQLGQLAQQQAESPAVKQFAERMVTDHGQNDQQLQQMATNLEGKQYQKMQQQMQKKMKSLEGKQGASFDKAYMSFMVKDHQNDTKEIGNAAKQAKKSDPELATFLQQTEATIKSHLQEAKRVEKQVKKEKQGQAQQGGAQTGGMGSSGGQGASQGSGATGGTGAGTGAGGAGSGSVGQPGTGQ